LLWFERQKEEKIIAASVESPIPNHQLARLPNPKRLEHLHQELRGPAGSQLPVDSDILIWE